jgi:L-iditol 2-dehydrogenase
VAGISFDGRWTIMKAAHFTGLRELAICEVPEPRVMHPGLVLVRIDRVGVCGSDVHYYTEGGIGDQILQYPASVGHECSGTIVEIGTNVSALKPGDRVAIDPAISCGKCDQCCADRPNTCRHLQFMGSPGEAPGALAELRVLPAENCFPIPETLSLDQAALAEPLSIGLHAVHLADLRPGVRFAITGAGPIGLSVLLCARALVQGTAYVTDLLDTRLEAARRCGANWTANAGRDDVAVAIAEREPFGLDVVFECSGDVACIDQAMKLLAPGGTLVLVGIPLQRRASFDIHVMRRKELTFKNVRRQRYCVAPVVQMLAEGRIDPDPLLTHRFPLGQIREAFELVAAYRDGVIKAMVDVSGTELL